MLFLMINESRSCLHSVGLCRLWGRVRPLPDWSSPCLGLSERLLNDWMDININPGHLGNVNLSSLRLWGNKVRTLLLLQNQAFPCTRVRELWKEWSLEWENQWSVGEWLKCDDEFTPWQVGTGQTWVWFPNFAAYEQCDLEKLAQPLWASFFAHKVVK